MGDIMAVLKEKGKEVDAEIFRLLPDKEPKMLYDMMKDYPSRGGKRLRPALVLTTCEAFGGNPKKAMLTAASMELFQDWILIHDDIEDGSLERRGKPCLHVSHGMELAINAGDALHVLMWGALFRNRDIIGDNKTFDILHEFEHMLTETTEGQQYEVAWVHFKKWDISEEDYYTMCRKKTSWYTIITPCRLGAIIAGADSRYLDAFVKLGIDWGIAFQIQDDVLNLIGEKGKYGKEIAGDIYEGKRTLMLIHLLKNCTAAEKKKVISIMNKPREKKTKKQVDYVLGLMRKYGSIDYGKQKAKEFAEKAKKVFDAEFAGMPEGQAKTFLRDLIDFVINREL
jgi:geranylgeranyl diphosphate synthase type II